MTTNNRKPTARTVKSALHEFVDADRAALCWRYFKAGPGEYAEGDKFIGLTVPQQRKIARGFRNLPLKEVQRLLDDPVHECRFTALVILVDQFEQAKNETVRKTIYEFYLRQIDHVNNWDLVDTSAPKIVGAYLWQKSHQPLFKLARARHLWKNRIAIVSTMYFIRQGDFDTTLALAEELMEHPHDLIHKAVGWMLREVGDKDRAVLTCFLQKHARIMPRTMLRYAIEKLPAAQRELFLKLKSR
ncbi:MAG: DNA alkylation repair protein [Pirellulaceae bacterium]